jgi:hypothetical protein
MISGPGYEGWIERREVGWMVYEVGGGWSASYGPYRWKWRAWLQLWSVAP